MGNIIIIYTYIRTNNIGTNTIHTLEQTDFVREHDPMKRQTNAKTCTEHLSFYFLYNVNAHAQYCSDRIHTQRLLKINSANMDQITHDAVIRLTIQR